MRSGANCTINSSRVHSWILEILLQARLLKDHGWKCTAEVVLSIVLRAAARSISVSAACRDLAKAPSYQAVMDALADSLPKTIPVLEGRLNDALTDPLPRRMRRRKWEIAVDLHLQPYYGQPQKSFSELYYGKPKQGTKHFHAYASACILDHGQRYTLAAIWVRRRNSLADVLQRLVAIIRKKGLKIKRALLDRAFFNLPVVEFLQAQELPFLMPVVIRRRAPRRGRKRTGLRWIEQQSAGWYPHTLRNGKREAKLSVCVGYRRHRNRRDGKQVHQKLLFAAWRVHVSPTKIREQYRRRFGIETSYRQMRQARIYTCTRSPRLRLFFLILGLILRNVWVWIHHIKLAKGTGVNFQIHLKLLRFKRMLDWIANEVAARYHDGSMTYVNRPA